MSQTGFRFSIFSVLLFCACTSSKPGLFNKGTPHDQYGKGLDNAGLKATSLGVKWFSEAEAALLRPQAVTLPFRQAGYFAADGHRALGLSFKAKRGTKLVVSLSKNPGSGFLVFTELWAARPDGRPTLLASMDTVAAQLSYDVDDEESFILRLQPELLRSGDYTLSIALSPSLRFPVAGKNGRVQSIWGDARDAGARRHEGIDIFAPKRTPVVAAAAGTVFRVEQTSIGGKVVWLRPKGRQLSIYYAHLDSQLVRDNEDVQAGDTLGLMGNTGNARTTGPHLHFGIYGFGGAIDPLPFVSADNGEAPLLQPSFDIHRFWRLSRDYTNNMQQVKKNTPVFITDRSAASVVGTLPDGRTISLPHSFVQKADNQLVGVKIKDSLLLYESPVVQSPVKETLPGGAFLKVIGLYNGFSLVVVQGLTGWVVLPHQRPI